ncbi:MAG: SMC-Scp complex subunit ScpB [Candidatus Odinarchaeota archaeon]
MSDGSQQENNRAKKPDDKDLESSSPVSEEKTGDGNQEVVEETAAEQVQTGEDTVESTAASEEELETTEGQEAVETAGESTAASEEELETTEGQETVETAGETWDPMEFERLLEGAFFAAGRPLSLEKLEEIFAPIPVTEIKRHIQAIDLKLTETKSAMRLEEVSKDTYVLCLVSEFEELIQPFITKTKKGLFADPKVMEVITNVAYRQPISTAMLARVMSDKVNQAETKNIITTLVTKGYINEKEKGRSTQLMVTTKFMNEFGFSHDTRKMKLQILWRLKRGK